MFRLDAAARPTSSDPLEPEAAGVVVEEVAKGLALYRAGVRPGDLIFFWRRGGSRETPKPVGGGIRSVFDWEWIQVEEAPRGHVELLGHRGSEARAFTVEPGSWRAQVRPPLSPAGIESLLEGLALITAGHPDAGISKVRTIAAASPSLKCWVNFRAGRALADAGYLAEARRVYLEALEECGDPPSRVALQDAVGALTERLGALAEAGAAYEKALETRRATWGEESLSVAKSRSDLGTLAWKRGDLKLAAGHHRHALALRRKLAPGSLVIADSLRALSTVAGLAGDFNAATTHISAALLIQEKLAPQSLAMAESLNHRGILAGLVGQTAAAEDDFSRALDLFLSLEKTGLGVATASINLGRIAWKRGDLKAARHHYLRALAIQEKLAPGSENLAVLLKNLGLLAWDEGQLDAAERYFERSLILRERSQKALESGPAESIFAADSLFFLGRAALERGRHGDAERHFRRAYEIQQRVAPDSLFQADSLFYLGKTAEARGELEKAVGFHRRALSIREASAPGSTDETESLHCLGRLLRAKDREQAVALFAEAVDSLDAQVGMLGGSQEIQSSFRARYRPLYQDSIDLLLELDRGEEAFYVLERSRARSFLAMLAEKDLFFAGDLPAELEAARRALAAKLDRTLERLFRVSPQEREAFAAITRRLEAIHRERESLIAEIRRVARRFGALRYPQPFNLAKARAALDPGTLMLSYNVGKNSTSIFAVSREGGLDVARVELTQEELRAQVALVRRLIRASSSGTQIRAIRHAQFLSAARKLAESLIRPVAHRIEQSERVLIVPDGPLHVLPFRALVVEPPKSSAEVSPEPRYLVEWKPLHTALSATVWSELREASVSSAKRSGVQVTAFGDPHFPPELTDLQPLPYSRKEIERIAALYPPSSTRAYLGEEATEERAKAVGRETRILHFATHTRIDDRFPLQSALALAVPEGKTEGRENGLLQTFEIFEGLRLEAELVVLSACETALGQEISGEGLIGLTRAFQYAGAQAVAASLWNVRDRATAELMARFHSHLRDTLPKDEALRAAQLELIREAAPPFVWAAFELYGDWR